MVAGVFDALIVFERPEPGGATNTAGIAMFRRDYGGVGFFPKYILRNLRRDVEIETLDFGHAATEDDDVGIEDIYDLRERASETIFVAVESGDGLRISFGRERGDFFGRFGQAGCSLKVGSETGA